MSVAMAAGNTPGETVKYPAKFDVEKRLPPIPPGKDDFTTAVLKNPISDTQFTELMGIDEAIVVRLLIKYTDSSGSPYETRICVSHLGTGATQYCQHEEENCIK